jgi:hypothetical protein
MVLFWSTQEASLFGSFLLRIRTRSWNGELIGSYVKQLDEFGLRR